MSFAERLQQQADKAFRQGKASFPNGSVLKPKKFEYDNYIKVKVVQK